MEDYQAWPQEILAMLQDAKTAEDVQAVRTVWLGKKGRIAAAMKQLGQMDANQRKQMGQVLNQVRDWAQNEFTRQLDQLARDEETRQLSREKLDMT
ncbi:MAG: hypothetical protein OWS74_04225, partial [Firmicutes bacterium]|nr:hypothetical protein [Bacillota bacterium]